MNTNQIPELLSYDEAHDKLRENGCGWRAANILLAGVESYLADPRWPDADIQPARVWRPILESYVRHKEAERAERNGQSCPERVPCPHTIGEHRGVKGSLGCSVEGCPCNVQYVFALNGKDEIRFRADFTGTDKIAGEERWQAFPLTVEFAGIGVDVGHNGTTDGETEEKHFIQIDASRFFKLAAAFVDCVRANAEERRLSDVRAIRSHKDAETWLKRVSLARAVEGILTLKTDARMGSQPIDNPGAVQGAARAPAASAPPSRLVRPIDAADDLYQELLAHFDGLQSGASLFYRAVVSIQQHMAAYRDARDRERKGDPSGLSSVMHDAHTHPRRPDPISLGEELDEPESDEK